MRSKIRPDRPTAESLTKLSGQVERITYVNPENGYTVARLKVRGQRELVTVVGSLMGPAPGEILNMLGEWKNHPRFGEQFKVVYYRSVVPATVYGIEKYLGSSMIKGIGPVMAKRIVKRFGKRTLDIIETDAEQLIKVEGIGPKRLEMICRAWEDQKEIREVMIFLQTYGVSSGYAAKIYKQYGNGAIAIVRDNPYRLATDIFGIGFVTADGIAEKLGFAKDAPARIQAGILYVLHQLSDDGHVYCPHGRLVTECGQLFEVAAEQITLALGTLAAEKRIVIEPLADMDSTNAAVYLAKFHLCETRITDHLSALVRTPSRLAVLDIGHALDWVQQRLSIVLATDQQTALRATLEDNVVVITGGPGTGKTTLIRALVMIFVRLEQRVLLSAPTGRAAKRMTEAAGAEARTVHRLLEYSFKTGGFQRDADHPLACDLLILDETSMVDTVLMHHLLKALSPGTRLVLVGDANQLPSVGAGAVLADIIAAGVVPVVTLTRIFRQALESRIVVNAHRINRGQMPQRQPAGERTDFYFRQRQDPQEALDFIVELTSDHIPRVFGFDPLNDIQILSPMHRGIVGTGNLNTALQEALNPGDGGLVRGARTYRVNDKVMQVKNNYDKRVFNGDIGRIQHIDNELQEMDVTYDGRRVRYDFTDLDEIILAYAVSVHKAQGSEYPVVIIPIMTQHYILLQRNLIYTAVTRGKQLVVVVGSYRALAMGIHNDKTLKRHTRLEQRLVTRLGRHRPSQTR